MKRYADEINYYEGAGQGRFSDPMTQMGVPSAPLRGTHQANSTHVYRDIFGNSSTTVPQNAPDLPTASKRPRFNSSTKTPTSFSATFFSSCHRRTPTKKSHKRARSAGGANFNILLNKNVNELRNDNAQYVQKIRKTLSPEVLMGERENGTFPYYDGSSPLSSVQGSTKLGHRHAKRRAGYQHFQALLEDGGKTETGVDEFGKVLEEYNRGF